ncbi:hypothetical protein ACFO5K_04375 [Nocardia halotolerans]|uniref:Uncharacterized protein n=1 Tax=Nocardia halotolerans TaxID=1755878 RepID=A0ABV8VE07_9NOCA
MTTFERVIGIDLSLTATGIAQSRVGEQTADLRVIETTGRKNDRWIDRWHRLGYITHTISHHVIVNAPTLAVIEAPAYASNTGAMHDRSGAWWLTYSMLADEGVPILPVAPNIRAKYATGKGNASKDEVLAAAVRRYPLLDINSNDTADAVILMAIGRRLIGDPIDDLPAKHLEALATLEIPHG